MPKPFAGSWYTAAKALIDALAKYSAKTVKGLCIRSGSILGLSEFMPEIRGQAWEAALALAPQRLDRFAHPRHTKLVN